MSQPPGGPGTGHGPAHPPPSGPTTGQWSAAGQSTHPAPTWGAPPQQAPKPQRRRDRWAPFLGVIKDTLRGVFLEPVNAGRPQPDQWTPGLRVLMGVTALLALALAVVAALGPVLRRGTLISNDEFLTLPDWSVSVLLWLAVFIASLVISATLHVTPVFHVTICLLFGSVTTAMAVISGVKFWLLTLACFVVMLVLPLLVRRQGWKLWQFLLVWLLYTAAVQVPLAFNRFSELGADFRTLLTLTLLGVLVVAAWPAISMAGYSAIEIVVTTAQWFAHSMRDLGSRFLNRWLLAAVLLTGVVRGASIVRTFVLDPPASLDGWVIGGSAAVLLLATAFTLAGWTWCRAVASHPQQVWQATRPGQLAERWNPWALATALVLGVLLIPRSILSWTSNVVRTTGGGDGDASRALEWLDDLIRGSTIDAALRALWALAVFVWAVTRARRHQAVMVLLSASLLAVMVLPLASRLGGDALPVAWSLDLVSAMAAGIALLWLLWRSVTGTLHNGTLTAVWVVWLLGIVHQMRRVLDDPSSLLAGISTVGLVILGLVWRLLTDGEYARRDSKAFPRSARVLLIMANALLGMFTLALTGLTSDQSGPISISSVDEAGEFLIGGVLLTAALLAPMLAPLFDRRR